MNRGHHIAITLTAVLAIVCAYGCSQLPEGSNLSGADSQKAGSTSTTEEPKDSETGSDDAVWINGSYLACDYDAVTGESKDTVRVVCHLVLAPDSKVQGSWNWQIINAHGAPDSLINLKVDGTTATFEVPASLLPSVSLAVRPGGSSPSAMAVTAEVKQAVLNSELGTASDPASATKQNALMECLTGTVKAASLCFADAGYKKENLIGPGAVASAAHDTQTQSPAVHSQIDEKPGMAEDLPCTPGSRDFLPGIREFTLPKGCAMRVSLWGGGGGGGGLAAGEDGKASTFLDLQAGGGGGGQACAEGGDGGLGGDINFEYFIDDGGMGDDGEAADVDGLVGGAGGEAPTPGDQDPLPSGGQPGEGATERGGGGGGATGIQTCGGGGGAGGFIMAEYTASYLTELGIEATKDATYSFNFVVGRRGNADKDSNAGHGGPGLVRIEWYPEEL